MRVTERRCERESVGHARVHAEVTTGLLVLGSPAQGSPAQAGSGVFWPKNTQGPTNGQTRQTDSWAGRQLGRQTDFWAARQLGTTPACLLLSHITCQPVSPPGT